MTLPAEIRNEIYGYLLEEIAPVEITLTRAGVLGRRSPVQGKRGGYVRKKRLRGRKLDNETGEWLPATPIKSAIIYVNRQFHNEAINILYGKNCFSFLRTSEVKRILAVLEKHAELFRHVRIEAKGYSRASARAAFDSLSVAKNLRTIEINHADICPIPVNADPRWRVHCAPVEHVAAASKNLLEVLHQSYQQENISANVLEVITLKRLFYSRGVVHDCSVCDIVAQGVNVSSYTAKHPDPTKHSKEDCSCMCSETKAGHEKLQAKLRSLIAKSLNLPDTMTLG